MSTTIRQAQADTTAAAGIDPRGPQFAATLTAIVLIAVLLLAPGPAAVAVLAFQTAVFAVGAARGVQHTPYAWLFRTIRPRLGAPGEREDPAPPRFAQTGGLGFAVAGLLGFLTGVDALGLVATGFAWLAASPTPLLNAADATLLVTRATLPSISAARSWAVTIRQSATGWRHPGLLLVAEGQPYRATEVTKVLGMPVIADLLDDPAAAAVYHRGAAPPKHFETGPYVRALQAAVQSVQAHVARGRFALVEEARA